MTGSLIERAAQVYDFGAAMRVRGDALAAVEATRPAPVAPAPAPVPAAAKATYRSVARRSGTVDREAMAEQGFILPDSGVSAVAEEFRIIKRQLLQTALAGQVEGSDGDPAARTILVCSAQPNEGKTFCAINLALSLATERDLEVILVDADVAKPEVLSTLGLEAGPGLIDAIIDPSVDLESCLIRTDIGSLSVLPAGSLAPEATELLASERAKALFEALSAPGDRILILDSPPALAASAATALADRAGQIVMVVRADRTGESELREAVALIGAHVPVQLVLNNVSYNPGGTRFGSYYGYGV